MLYGREKMKREKIVKLYKEYTSIKDICKECKVSVNTVYKVLREEKVPLMSGRYGVRRTITFDEETEKLLKKANPNNISAWVCEMIKRGYEKR